MAKTETDFVDDQVADYLTGTAVAYHSLAMQMADTTPHKLNAQRFFVLRSALNIKGYMNKWEALKAIREARQVEPAERYKQAWGELADLVGKALVALSLSPGEKLSRPGSHALIHDILRLQKRLWNAEKRLAKLDYKTSTK